MYKILFLLCLLLLLFYVIQIQVGQDEALVAAKNNLESSARSRREPRKDRLVQDKCFLANRPFSKV